MVSTSQNKSRVNQFFIQAGCFPPDHSKNLTPCNYTVLFLTLGYSLSNTFTTSVATRAIAYLVVQMLAPFSH